MESKKFTNAQIVTILDGVTGQKGRVMRDKNLPFKVLYALRRSVPEIEAAYKAYNATLQDICKKYGVTTAEAGRTDNAECKAEVTALLETETSVNIHAIRPEVLEECNGDKYSTLTYNDIDRLWWLITDGEES